jgi:chromosome segregation ATPase
MISVSLLNIELTRLQSNLKLRHECKKLEQAIKRREEVSSELHMIDFEQLKIENQSLNEKIEERNEELLKLRKKTTSTVQVLTHLKEKLQFVQAENQVLKAELTGLESDLGQHRDAVTKVKLQRDQLRQENAKLKASASVAMVCLHRELTRLFQAKSGLVGNILLLRDFDRRKREIESMEVRMTSLKEAQLQLTKEVKRHSEPLARLTSSTHKR